MLRDLEAKRMWLETEARRAQVLIEELRHQGGNGAKGDELDEQVRAILQKFGTDTYALPPSLKERLAPTFSAWSALHRSPKLA